MERRSDCGALATLELEQEREQELGQEREQELEQEQELGQERERELEQERELGQEREQEREREREREREQVTNIAMLVRDRLKLTKQSIESLYDNTQQSEFTLTVVDDGSEFLTKRYLSGLDYSNLSVVRVESSGHVLSQLKNLGVYWTRQRFKHHRGGWLYLSDNDVCFRPKWLDTMIAAAEATEGYGFRLWGGQVHPYHQPIQSVEFITEHSVIDGPSWLMRWDTWNAWGPLDRNTAPGVCQSEDHEFCQRLIKARYRLGVTKPHVVVHAGLTNSSGEPAPGYEARLSQKVEGVYYE